METKVNFLYLLFLVVSENCKAPSLGEVASILSCFQLHIWPRTAQGCEGDVKPHLFHHCYAHP